MSKLSEKEISIVLVRFRYSTLQYTVVVCVSSTRDYSKNISTFQVPFTHKPLQHSRKVVLTLLYSKSQHFTCLSSPQENKYGCRVLTTRPRTVLICPVNESFKRPLAKSQICNQYKHLKIK